MFGLIGVLVVSGLLIVTRRWCEEEGGRRSHAVLMELMEELRRGRIDCLVQPDPRFIDELLADVACASKVRDLYLGADVSDPRLGRLRELPNLKSVVLLSAIAPDEFLKELRGSTTIEELSMVFCIPSHRGVEHIHKLPKLKRFGLCINRLNRGDWESIRKALPGCQCNLIVSNR
jgi:hypothetical protein